MTKPNIAILFGGMSPEYDVSLQSAYSVITHINREKYEPHLIGITRTGEWHLFTGDPKKIAGDTWVSPEDCMRAVISPDRETNGVLVFGKYEVWTIKLDAAMPILHGKNGEDGTIQGLLQLAGIPIIGCGTLSSALCMDKEKAHKLASMAGINVPKSVVIDSEEDKLLEAKNLIYPLFVKPVNCGSSFGITKVNSPSELPTAVSHAFKYDSRVIIEENIPGFEVGCAVLGNKNLIVGKIDEIELTDGFFDYTEKYGLNKTNIHVPARITAEKAEEIVLTAQKIYRALDCQGFARVDMFVAPQGKIVFNEVNTIPGFTTHSRYPNMLKAVGMTFEEIVNEIIRLGVESGA